MNKQQALLGKLAEEASELAHAALKAQMFGLENSHEGLSKVGMLDSEIKDVLALLVLAHRQLGTKNPLELTESEINNKLDKCSHYWGLMSHNLEPPL